MKRVNGCKNVPKKGVHVEAFSPYVANERANTSVQETKAALLQTEVNKGTGSCLNSTAPRIRGVEFCAIGTANIGTPKKMEQFIIKTAWVSIFLFPAQCPSPIECSNQWQLSRMQQL